MDIILFICLFLAILITYLHIMKEYAYSTNLNVYEADYIDNQNFQSICSLGQPFIMNLDVTCVYNIDKDSYLHVKDACDNEVVSISYGSLENLINQEKQYYSERNKDFVTQHLSENYTKCDDYLKPYMNLYTHYDYILGSPNVNTNTKYHTSSRLFLYVKSGQIEAKFSCWNSKSIMEPFIDYEHLEFLSEKNIWEMCDNVISITVNEGQVVFVPPWWFYSIRFIEKSEIFYFEYQTMLNFTLNSHHLCLHHLQKSNIRSQVLEYAKNSM